MSSSNLEQNDEINLVFRYMGLNSEKNDGWEVYARKPQNKGGKRAGKEWSPQNPSTKAWAKKKTKTWGHPDIFDISGMCKNVELRWGSRYNWYAPNDPRKLTMTQLNDGGLTSPASVPPTRKNAWDWSAKATSAYPKNTSPVADDDKVGGHDIEDNEFEKHDTDDYKGFVKDNFMITKF
ncbi:hypothetical protein FXO38_35023 [Capsicum annuum]|nr:hypothetical protein FXO38_35023 [Capsicum annuum]